MLFEETLVWYLTQFDEVLRQRLSPTESTGHDE